MKKLLIMTVDYLRNIPDQSMKYQVFKRQKCFTEQFIDLKQIFLTYQQVYLLTKYRKQINDSSYEKIL